MAYSVKILADSTAPCGKRLTTWELEYPRMVHSEMLTHRTMSRNSASSRAIPIDKIIQQVIDDPALPKWWGKNQSGMQAREELSEEGGAWSDRRQAEANWLRARNNAVDDARRLQALGLHKQIVNRIIEPWMFITVILSGTEFDNFFRLRCHPDAQPEIKWVADEMKRQYDATTPRELKEGEWHLPLIHEEDRNIVPWHASVSDGVMSDEQQNALLCKVATGRCARVSYLTHDGKRDMSKDVELHDKLTESGHWSPFEHIACALSKPERIGNFIGWRQYRADVDPNFLR